MAFKCAAGCGVTVYNPGETCTGCKAKSMLGGLKKPVVQPQAVAPTLAPGALPVGATLQLKCRGRGQMAWTTLVPNGTIYVLKGTEVEFKADSVGGVVPPGSTIRYERAQWGGTAGATGASAVKPITFSANSASNVAPSTVTVALGGQTVLVNIIVYTLNVDSTPADDFNLRSQDQLGVDERVELGFNTTPAGVSAADAGGLQWRVAGGAVANRSTTGLLHNATTHTGPPLNDGRADYVAPYRTHAPTEQIQPSKEIVLKLCVVSGPSEGKGVERRYRVFKPVAHMTQAPATLPMHWNSGGDEPSAGFYGQIYFAPKNVSFRTLRWREGTGTLEDTLGGTEQGTIHATTAHSNALHGTLNDGDAATGCYVNQVDTVRSAGDSAQVNSKGSPTTKMGHKKWPITWEYTYANLDPSLPNGGTAWANDWIAMQKAHHTFTQFENGRSEIFKGHVGCSECMQPISRDPGAAHYWP